MADTKKYYIEINGIKESVDAVDSLLKKLENLEQRIDVINQKQATVSTASGGSGGGGSKSRVSDLTAEQKIIDQINRSQEKREVLEGEIGKKLADEKQAMKELNAEQKSLAAMDRIEKSGILNGGDLPKTMLGMKSELADIKAAMQTMEVGSDEFLKATERANQLNEALKKIEETYGQYGRNVGNYAGSIADALGAMDGITIKIGEQEVKFNSTKEAMRTMKENLKQMTVEGKQNTEEYNNNIKALHELEMALQEADSAINDVKTSSQGMDEALDWMQSFGAMGQITQGFSAFFGNTGFEESIQKLMSLQSMLQGLEQLRKQMNTGEGFGGMFKSMSQGADEAAAKMLRVKGGMEGLATASKATQIAVKGLSTVMKGLAGLGIGLLIDGAMKLADKVGSLITGWLGGNDAVIDSNKAVAASIEMENQRLAEQEEQLKKDYEAGKLSAEELYKKGVQAKADSIEKTLNDLDTFIAKSEEVDEKINSQIRKNLQEGIQQGKGIGTEWYTPRIEINNLKEGVEQWGIYTRAVKSGVDAWEQMEREGIDLSHEFALGAKEALATAEDTRQELQAINAVGFGEFKKKLADAVATLRTNFDEGVKKINELKQELTSNDWLNSVLNHPENLIDLPGFISYVNQIKSLFNGLKTDIAGADLGEFAKRQLGIDAMKDGFAKRKAQIDLNLDKEREQYKGSLNQKLSDDKDAMTVEEALQKKHDNAILAAQQQTAKKTVSTAKHTAKQTLDVQKETQRLELELMAEGYLKELTKMKQERDDQLRRFKGHNDLMLKAEQLYIKKSTELREKYQKEFSESYKRVWSEVLSYTLSNTELELQNVEQEIDNMRSKFEKDRETFFYGSSFFTAFPDELRQNLKNLKELITDMQYETDKEILEGHKRTLDAWKKEYEDTDKWNPVKKLFGEDNVQTFEDFLAYYKNFMGQVDDYRTFWENENEIVNYYSKLLKIRPAGQNEFTAPDIYKAYEEAYKKQKEVLDRQRDEEKNANADWWEEQNQTAIDAYEKRIAIEEANNDKILELRKKLAKAKTDTDKEEIEAEIWKERYLDDNIIPILEEREETLNRITDEALSKQTSLVQKYVLKQEEIENNKNKRQQEDLRRYFDDITQEYRDYYSQIEKAAQNAEQHNAWGFTDWGKFKNDTKGAISNLEQLKAKVVGAIKNLNEVKDSLTADEYKNAARDLLGELEQIESKIKELNGQITPGKQLERFFQEVQQYYSAVSDSFQTIMGAMDDLNNYYFDLQQNALDKENELLQKKLDENEEILERHKNNVDKIESQLADARGDRRERLIDALNQEIIAQRRAQAEKEKLEKEQEKLEQKQKDLDYEREVAEYKSGLRQILFQTSQAVMQAATNNWPIPAIPLMALAAATGAAQYVMAQKQVPIKKADGGILEGPSHSEGGIPVGDTGIEVEGQEFIINKRQTAANRELIEAINNGNGKLTLEDIMNVGGITNVQPLEINAPENTSLETAFAVYANRPIWVSVQDINSTQESVRRVEVLSGKRG